MKKIIFATAVLMSSIVGAGMFALPYTGAQSGFLIAAVFLLVLTGIMLVVHLLYGEIVIRTKEKHRLIGYAEHYLGKGGKAWLGFFLIPGTYGAMLVYIIMGGIFLHTIFSSLINMPVAFFSLIFFAIGVIVFYFGLELLAELDLIMGLFLILIIFLFLYFGLSHVELGNLRVTNLKSAFIPYGAILYALTGFAAIPEIREFFSKNGKGYKKAIVLGTIIPAILYLIFMWVVIGLTGLNTSPEAIEGLIGLMGRKIVFLGSLFGFLATITSFFVLGISLKKTFWYDFKVNKHLSWFLVCIVPLALFLLGIRDFIPIILIVGSFLIGMRTVIIVFINKKVRKLTEEFPDYNLKIPEFLKYIIILVFALGLILTLISVI